MRRYWPKPAGGGRLAGSARSNWKVLSGAAAAALAVTLAPGEAMAAPVGTAPATPTVNAILLGMSALSATDAWAVGTYTTIATNVGGALTEHWNGTAWKKVSNPNLPGSDLAGVSAASANDVWAVGEDPAYGGQSQLIEHWNGTRWTRVATSVIPNGTHLLGVSGVSATNAWAVGWCSSAGHTQPVILRWNGKHWALATVPAFPAGASLKAVSATSATNAWAVGTHLDSTGVSQMLILHWNGTSWTQDTTISSPGATLSGVSADSATDAWATGFDGSSKTLILHNTGTGWTRVTSPSPGTGPPGPAGLQVSAQSPTNIWAVNSWSTSGASKTLVLHGNGTSWKHVAAPNPSPDANFLRGVSTDSATDAWAVGWYAVGGGGFDKTLALHWNGTSWTKVTTPN